MIKRILYAADFADHTREAQDYVIQLAQALGASVDVLHAIEPFPDGEDEHAFDDLYQQLEARAEVELATVAAALGEAQVRCTTKVVVEKRWRAINERAEREGADLVVMGARASGARDAPPLGSTSHKVFLTGRVPLLVVREKT